MANQISNRTLIISGPARTIQRGYSTHVIEDSDWDKYIAPVLYPLWDSDKDRLQNLTYHDTPEVYWSIRKAKYVRNHTTGEYFWKEYLLTEVTDDDVEKLVADVAEALDAIISISRTDLDNLMNRILEKEKGLSLSRIKAWRDFFLYSSDWTMLEDAPVTAEEKQQWLLYRSKVRELPELFSAGVKVLSEIRIPIDPLVYKRNYLPFHDGVGYLETEEQYVLFPGKDAPGGVLDQAMYAYMRLAVRIARPSPLFNVPSLSHITDPIDVLVAEIEREQALLDELRAQQNDTTQS